MASSARRVNRKKAASWAGAHAAATEEYPFGPQAAVFKVGGKMFALVPTDQESVTVKADPEDALALRSQFEAVQPGYHMNKRHWITIDLGPDGQQVPVQDLIEDSYDLVVASLSKKARRELGLEA